MAMKIYGHENGRAEVEVEGLGVVGPSEARWQ